MPVPRTLLRAVATCVAAIAVAVALAGCGIRIPTDPDGALDRITGGQLRVGASASEGLVALEDGAVSGPLPDLVAAFADSRDATVVWTVGSEEDLVDDLEAGTLDLAIGGMSEETPWVDRVSVTRGFDDLPGVDAGGVVFLLPMGENGLQAALEMFLDEQSRTGSGAGR